MVWCSVYTVCPSVLSCSNHKIHQYKTLVVKNIFKHENVMLQLTFNSGLTLTAFRLTRPRPLGLLLNAKQWLLSWYIYFFILNVINEKKRVLNTERNNTYLAEASISPHFTTTCDFDKYTIILHFGGKHHQNFCHPEIKDHRQILDVFLKHITIISWR